MSYPTYSDLELEIQELEQENKKLKENIAWYEKEEDRLREENKKLKEEIEKDNRKVQVDVDKELLKANDYLIKENKKLKSDLGTVINERDNAFKKIEQLKQDIDNCFNRETDLRNKRADSLLENKDLRDDIEQLKEELGKFIMNNPS